jgi:DNA-binding CsgD family transcriptional regulator
MLEQTVTLQVKTREWLNTLPHMPMFFLGLGIYRAWIEIVFVGSFLDFPIASIAGQNPFDLSMVFFLLVCGFFAKRIKSLLPHVAAYIGSSVLLTLSTIMMFAIIFFPQFAMQLGLPAAIIGGAGIAFVILMWSELYSCLNSMRVALYYCVSIIVGAFIIYLARGMYLPWVFALSLILPLLSLFCALLSYNSIPEKETPVVPKSWFTYPWKPTLLMATYGLAFGLREVELYNSSFGPHSSPGTVAAAALVVVGLLVQGKRFDFTVIYRVGLPLMICAFLLVPSFDLFLPVVTDFCISASYAAFSILTMIIFANMGYRFGISALWLFGLERAIRALFVFFGRMISNNASLLSFSVIEPEVLIFLITVVLLVTLTMLLVSERELSSRWGVRFLGSIDNDEDAPIVSKQTLSISITSLAKKYKLTQREEEVLLLLAQGASISQIERDLFIANGTAKAHVRHIYKKMDIHSRDELLKLIGNTESV